MMSRVARPQPRGTLTLRVSSSAARSCHQHSPFPTQAAAALKYSVPSVPKRTAPTIAEMMTRIAVMSTARRLRRAAPSACRPRFAPVAAQLAMTASAVGTTSG